MMCKICNDETPKEDNLFCAFCEDLAREDEDRKRDVHVVPVFKGEAKHAETKNCWCEPELIEWNVHADVKVWSHRRPE